MRTVTIEQKDLKVQDLFKLAAVEPVILTQKDGQALAIIPVDELDVEAWRLGDNPKFMEIIERSRARYRREGGVSLAEVRRRVGLVPAG